MIQKLQYPFDANYIIAKKKKLRRMLLEQNVNYVDKKIAILGGYTTSNIKLIMELFLLDNGIRPKFYESEYNQYYQDAMFPNEELEQFKPDIIYVCTSNRNITSYPAMSDSAKDIDSMLQSEADKFYGMWDKLAATYNCPVIQNNFEMPYYRLLGNKDAYDIHGKTNFITRLNMKFYEYAQQHEDFYICDVNYISADYGLKEWSNPFYYHMYKYAVAVPAIPYLSHNVANIIKSLFGKNKKGFVLDLDNTLWGGVIGDDGVDNIAVGPEESEGQVYSEFQQYIKEHKQLGVILNIDSKNDYENAIEGLKHPDNDLKEEDFIVIKANWDPKSKNLEDIASELNLLPESLVFVDDNPAERHIVTSQLPGVSAPDIGQASDYVVNIDRNGYFETTVISSDDAKRNEMYKVNAKRAKLEASFEDYGQYLESLEMKGTIKEFAPIYEARIAQLSNKSNQFNLTTRRYTQNEIEEIADSDDYITLYGKLEDKFGDNGVVSVVIGHICEGKDIDSDKIDNSLKVCDIDLWIMSCRVLKRDMEFAMMDTLVHRALERGIERLIGHYYPTAKNKMVKEFYKKMGFEKISEDDEGNSLWQLDILKGYDNQNRYIKVEE